MDSNKVYGVTLALGYEFMSFGGFFFRATGGVSFLTEEPEFNRDEERFRPTLHLGAGWKIH